MAAGARPPSISLMLLLLIVLARLSWASQSPFLSLSQFWPDILVLFIFFIAWRMQAAAGDGVSIHQIDAFRKAIQNWELCGGHNEAFSRCPFHTQTSESARPEPASRRASSVSKLRSRR